MKHASSSDRRQFLKAGTVALGLAGGLASIGKADGASPSTPLCGLSTEESWILPKVFSKILTVFS